MPDYTVHPEVREFLREQEVYRDGLMAAMKESPPYRGCVSEEQLWTNFKLMEIYDQMGQFICNRYPFNATHRKNGPTSTLSGIAAPVGPGREDAVLTFDIRDERNALVTPYPFDVDPLPVSFQARLVPDRRYETQEEFLQEYYGAERLVVEYMLHSS